MHIGKKRRITGFLAFFTLVLLTLTVSFAESDNINYIYDRAGRLLKAVARSGDATVYTYDEVGNLISIERLRVNSAPPVITSINPYVMIRGSSVLVELSGENLFALTAFTTDNQGIIIEEINSTDTKITARLFIPSSVNTGQYRFYIKTLYGETEIGFLVTSLRFSPERVILTVNQAKDVRLTIDPSIPSDYTVSIDNPSPQIVSVPVGATIPAGGSTTIQISGLSEGTAVLRINGVGLSITVTAPFEGEASVSDSVSVRMPILVRNNTKILSSPVSVGLYPEYTLMDSISVQLMDTLSTPRTYFSSVSVQMPFEATKRADEVNVVVEHRFAFKDIPFTAEGGVIKVDSNWQRIDLENRYLNPVVIAKPLSKNGGDPAVVRIRNVTSTGFEIRVQEWDYLDGTHVVEDVSYLVVESGHYVLDNGFHVEAGTVTTDRVDPNSSFEIVTFTTAFQNTPVVITSVMTENGPAPVVTRNRNVSTAGFEVIMQEEEAGDQVHASETIGYIAWEPGSGSINGINYEVSNAGDVTDAWTTVNYGPFNKKPVFLMDMQSTNGTDTANLRYLNKKASSIDIQVCEEQSADSETGHVAESIGYFAFY